jgi:hypothetical protein
MAFDPKKVIEITGEVMDSVGLVKRLRGLLPTRKPPKARRKGDWDPERDADRRTSSLELRLKTGVWLHFHRKTGLGQFQQMAGLERDNLIAAFVAEGVNYHFSERGSEALLTPSSIATSAVDVVCEKWGGRPMDDRPAIFMINELAEYVLFRYNVRAIDRRRGKRVQSMAG